MIRLTGSPIKLLVSGSRDHQDRTLIFSQLDQIHQRRHVHVLIHGAQRKWNGREYWGADYIAEEWARDRQIPYLGVPAMWNKLGREAGTRRNGQMLEIATPDVAIFFPLKNSVGTYNMKTKVEAHNHASAAKIEIIVVEPRV